jgi:hypothetical protein
LGQLKKYENVNKKALDQFVRAKAQKEGLSKSVDELKQNETVSAYMLKPNFTFCFSLSKL